MRLLLLLLCACSLQAATVTTRLQQLTGKPLMGNTFVRFELKNCGSYVPRVLSSANLVVPPKTDLRPNALGVVYGNIINNSLITCDVTGNTWYTVSVWNGGTKIYEQNFIIDGASVDLALLTPLGSTPTPLVPYVFYNYSTVSVGSLFYGSGYNQVSLLAGNATTVPKFLRQLGNGTVSSAPTWEPISGSDITDLTFDSFMGVLPAAKGPALSGDVTKPEGAAATTVATVGGKSATAIASSVTATEAATALNTALALVKRDNSGNIAVGTVTGNLTGNVTGNVTGNLTGNAQTVTNGVYTTGTYSDPSWLTSLAGSKIAGAVAAASALASDPADCPTGQFANGIDLNGNLICAQVFTGGPTGEGATPIGPAGGVLAGTYPSPTENTAYNPQFAGIHIATAATDFPIEIGVSGAGTALTGLRVSNAAASQVGQGSNIGFSNSSAVTGTALSAVAGSKTENATNGASGLYFGTFNGTSLAEAMRIDSTGQVGIGTSSPGTKLTVAGTISTSQDISQRALRLGRYSGASGLAYIEAGSTTTPAGLAILTYPGGVEKQALTLLEDGKLLVEATTDNGSGAKLQVGSNVSVTGTVPSIIMGYSGSTSAAKGRILVTQTNTPRLDLTTNAYYLTGASPGWRLDDPAVAGGAAVLNTAGFSYYNFPSGGALGDVKLPMIALRVDSNGNTLLGSSSDDTTAARLQVTSDASRSAISLVGSNPAYQGQLRIASDDYSQVSFYNSSAMAPNATNRKAHISYSHLSNLLDISNDVVAGYTSINSSGAFVLIGAVGSSAAPKGALEIRGTAGPPATSGSVAQNVKLRLGDPSSLGNVLDFGSYSASPYGVWLQAADRQYLDVKYPIILQPTGGRVGIGTTNPVADLTLAQNSTYKPGDNVWNSGSDIRMKENLRPFLDGMSVLREFTPKAWEFNGKGLSVANTTGIGVVAQEIETVAPYLVSIAQVPLNPGEAPTDLRTINTSAMTWILTNAVKELDERANRPTDTTEPLPPCNDQTRGNSRFVRDDLEGDVVKICGRQPPGPGETNPTYLWKTMLTFSTIPE